MDTSEKYIEMCRAATKIQKMWNPDMGDLRQDQLQDLLGDNLMDIVEGFYDYLTADDHECPEFDATHCYECESMEQLWLVYVMETKYGKRWDGIKWIDPDAPEEPLLPRIPQMILNFERGSMDAKYITMNQKTLRRISSERGESSLPPMYVPRICGLIPGIDDSLADDVMEIGGSPKEPSGSLSSHELLRQFTEDAKAFAALPKTVWAANRSGPETPKELPRPLTSRILKSRGRLRASNMAPTHLLVNKETWNKLTRELSFHDTTVMTDDIGRFCQVRVFDLDVEIINISGNNGFQVVGVPL